MPRSNDLTSAVKRRLRSRSAKSAKGVAPLTRELQKALSLVDALGVFEPQPYILPLEALGGFGTRAAVDNRDKSE